MSQGQTGLGYHVLVTVGDRQQLRPLLAVGCALARAHGGAVTLLCITPDGAQPDWLVVPEPSAASAMKPCDDVPLDVLVRPGRDAGANILTTARARMADLLVLGWRGSPSRGRYLLGSTLDPVIRYAPCDVAVVRANDRPTGSSGQDPPGVFGYVRRVLVPVAGGANASLALELALHLSPDVQVTAMYVVRDAVGQAKVVLGHERLDTTLKPWADRGRVQPKVVRAHNIIEGILTEADTGDYDLVLVGATGESFFDRVLFGNVPQAVAAGAPIPAIVVKRRASRVGTLLRRAGWKLFDALPTLTVAERADVYRNLQRGVRPHADFYVMTGLAAAIAAMGLLLNSPAVIIGAMLVAPLMLAVLGLGLGVVQGDLRLLRLAVSAVLRGALLAIAVGLLMGLYHARSPDAEPRAPHLARPGGGAGFRCSWRLRAVP